jgi:polysaccharide biosynthesis protein PslG
VRVALRSVLLAAVLLVPAPGAQALDTRGVQLHPFYSERRSEGVRRDVRLARRLGVTAVRVDLPWPSLEVADDRYDPFHLGMLDDLIASLRAPMRGPDGRALPPAKALLTIFQTPCWASSARPTVRRTCTFRHDHPAKLHPARDPRELGEIAAFVARRYGASRLAGIEVGNEPNEESNLHLASGPDTPERRARAVAADTRAVFRAVRRAAPGVRVVAGAVQGADVRFVRALYAAGIRGSFDVLSMHPYNIDRAPETLWPTDTGAWWRLKFDLRRGIPAVREVMIAEGDRDRRLWLTEVGWPSCTDEDHSCVSRTEQAAYLRGVVRQVAGLDDPALTRPYVTGLFAYELRNGRVGPPGCRECEYGLVTHGRRAKPAFGALRRAFAEVAAARAMVRLGSLGAL